ncbi:hypothetical protein EVAR_64726_1 [Eumeta japonica]|uniref:Uncharacterized protein n=1 Tax=Eumeta variegata TaxID=151549 RepID=A0A4C2A007_EUMVA|nr:hypothetical protein EVAR_64726_1 [Eumeta japonica]
MLKAIKAQYTARNSAAVKLVTKASQWRKISAWGRRRKGRGVLNLHITSFADNSRVAEFHALYFKTERLKGPRLITAVPPDREMGTSFYGPRCGLLFYVRTTGSRRSCVHSHGLPAHSVKLTDYTS